ncbi:hypothetical protein RCL1_001272 [Eukaryota sp. TZLM3-RCL]
MLSLNDLAKLSAKAHASPSLSPSLGHSPSSPKKPKIRIRTPNQMLKTSSSNLDSPLVASSSSLCSEFEDGESSLPLFSVPTSFSSTHSSQHSAPLPSISVFCRLKPSKRSIRFPLITTSEEDSVLVMKVPKIQNSAEVINNSKEKWSFPFSEILQQNSTNLDIFKEIGLPSVHSLFGNKSTTCLAYGMLGSGKTYSFYGSPSNSDPVHVGLIPNCLNNIFNRLIEDQEVMVSFYEVRNNSLFDLLQSEMIDSEKVASKLNTSLIMATSNNSQVHSLPGLSLLKVTSLEEALSLIEEGSRLRYVTTTEFNRHSTRSHVILSVHLVSRTQKTHSKLSFVDLAAFERLDDVNTKNPDFAESVQINKSLFFLEGVLSAITRKNSHIPYRNCLLTSVLRFVLSFCHHTVILATLSQDPRFIHDSLSTCLFFRRIGLVKGTKWKSETQAPTVVPVERDPIRRHRAQSVSRPRAQSVSQHRPLPSSPFHIPLIDSLINEAGINVELVETDTEVDTTEIEEPSSGVNSFIFGDVANDDVIQEVETDVSLSETTGHSQRDAFSPPPPPILTKKTSWDPTSFPTNRTSSFSSGTEELLSDPGLEDIMIEYEHRPKFNWNKIKGPIFYFSVIALFSILFFFFSPPSFSSVLGNWVCPETLELEHGTVHLSSSLFPSWNLHLGPNSFLHTVHFDADYEYPPQVFIAISSMDVSSSPLFYDVRVTAVDYTSFRINVVTQGNTRLREITITWIAVSSKCFEYSSADLIGFDLGISDFNSVDDSFVSMIDPIPTFFTPTSDLVLFSGVTGFHLDSPSLTSLVTISKDNEQVSLSPLITSPDSIEFGRMNILAVNSSLFRNTKMVVGNISVENLERMTHVTVDFDHVFMRLPSIALILTGFESASTPLSYEVSIQAVDFDRFTLRFLPFHDSSISSLSFSFLAIDTEINVLQASDYILLFIFILLIILALLLEYLKPSVKTSLNTGVEKYHVLPNDWNEALLDPEVFNSMTETARLKPPRRIFKNDIWLSMLDNWEKLKKTYQPGQRDRVEIFFWFSFALILLAVVFFYFRDQILKPKFFHSINSVYLTMFILGLEYFLVFLAFFTVSWPEHRIVKGFNEANTNVAILIASHISAGRDPHVILKGCKNNFKKPPSVEELKQLQSEKADGFERTLRLASRSTGDGNVYVCHNANMSEPYKNDGTVEVIQRIKEWGRTVNYVYVPTGNKTFSIQYVAKNILAYRPEIEYVVLMDDDVIIPSDMSWQTHRLTDPEIAGAVITIRADMNRPEKKNSWRRRSLLVWFQDMEYMMAGLMKLVQDQFGGCNYPHGAISIWKKDVLVEVLDNHNSAFHGEDAQMGFILRERQINGKYLRLTCFASTPALTQVPQELFHPFEDFFGDHVVDEKSLFTQRVKSYVFLVF